MDSLLSKLLSRLLIDHRNGHRRSVISKYHDLLRLSSLPPDEIRRYQDQRLADLLNHAAAHVPFWKSHINQPVTPENARDTLSGLPFMERSAIQSDQKHFVDEQITQSPAFAEASAIAEKAMADETADRPIPDNESPPGIVEDATGGSTGTPMRFKVDRATQIAREASLYWANHLAGWRYGDRVAMLWGSDRDVGNAKKNPRLELRWKIDNIRWYNAFDMGEDRMAEFHRQMTRFKPHIIVAYAGSLDIYARFLSSQSTNPPNYPITSLVSSAEVLTPQARETIEGVFRKPVFNRYGNRECGAIAAEDGEGGLLINQGDFIVEIDSPDPVREPGSILITYFSNRAMPFIRYNTGDLGVWGGGREGQRLARIAGRQGDTIRTRKGKLIHGEYFTHLMYGAKGVKEFQFVQETLDDYRLLVVTGPGYDPAQEGEWHRKIGEWVGMDARIEVGRVEAIPVLPSGKRKFTLSKLKS